MSLSAKIRTGFPFCNIKSDMAESNYHLIGRVTGKPNVEFRRIPRTGKPKDEIMNFASTVNPKERNFGKLQDQSQRGVKTDSARK